MNTLETLTRTVHIDLRDERSGPDHSNWDKILSGDYDLDIKNGDTIETRTVRFSDGIEADINLAAADPTPYLNVVFFGPEGHSIGHGEPVISLPADVELSLDNVTYRIEMK